MAGLVAEFFPGTEIVAAPPEGRLKPPMAPSDMPALAGFEWTAPTRGLEALMSGGAHGLARVGCADRAGARGTA